MKKFGILVFAAAVALGIFVASIFSFGRLDQRIFKFSINGKTRGSGHVVTESRDIKGFSGVDVGGTFQVEITARKDFAVEVSADDNLLSLITTEVRNGVLHIETEGRVSTDNPLKITISAPEIESIAASGVSNVGLVNVTGSELRVDASGASKVNVTGDIARLTAEASGASAINAEGVTAGSAEVSASGASRILVFATEDLHSEASGAATVLFSGNPASIEKRSSGAGSIREK
ncbi:MAG: head GIN domain-containing protein [Pyrinomonadaceae bacterium]